eukprot:scaffold59493_cov73-Phaeocystis_antarctica.AAC.4
MARACQHAARSGVSERDRQCIQWACAGGSSPLHAAAAVVSTDGTPHMLARPSETKQRSVMDRVRRRRLSPLHCRSLSGAGRTAAVPRRLCQHARWGRESARPAGGLPPAACRGRYLHGHWV